MPFLNLSHEQITTNRKISFQLEKSTDKFFLMRGKLQGQTPVADTTEYSFVIKKICLYVQSGTLSLPLYQEILRMWPENDILYHFRRFSVLNLNLGVSKQNYDSDQLWSESDSPSKFY